jgi:serine/threonine-protein kinase RsbW
VVDGVPAQEPRQALTAVLQLAPRSDAAAIARRFVHDNRDHLDPEIIANAQLLVSEIVTNAVRHGAGEITLTVRLDPPGIGVAVSDSSDRLPVMRDTLPPDDQASGRGLVIVDALASQWGVSPLFPPPGKTVWFDLRPES